MYPYLKKNSLVGGMLLQSFSSSADEKGLTYWSCFQHNLTCVNWLWNHVRNLYPENGKPRARQLRGPLVCTDIFDADETILITAKIPQEQTQRQRISLTPYPEALPK